MYLRELGRATQVPTVLGNIAPNPRRSSIKRTIGELGALFSEQLKLCRTDPKASLALAGQQTLPDGIDKSEAAAWVGLARTVLNLDEFITRQ